MDERFKQVLTDPRFKTLRKSERKVRIDGRFKQMFTDKRFKTTSDVDPRTGKVDAEEEHVNDKSLKSYYDTSDCDPPLPSGSRLDVRGVPDREDEDLSSSSDESSDEDGAEVDHNWAELDKDVPRSAETSHRLAICNMDWDRIKAQDLFVLLNSFKPGGASILSVKIYASEFGKKRMREEAVRGPTEIAETEVIGDEHETGDADEDEYMQEKLRQYQLNRLKYYYAIVDCDSQSTADSLYEQLDNFEFESSASSLDLRFVPEEETFDDEPAQVCTALPDSASYKPPIFITSALQQSSVRLTWDETDPSRTQMIESAFASRDEKQLDDLQTFLASEHSDSSDEEPEVLQPQPADEGEAMPTKLNKYKQLLQAVEEENKNEFPDIEITFDSDDVDKDSDQEANKAGERDDGNNASGDSNNESDDSGEEPESTSQDAAVNEHGDELHLLVEEEKSHFNFSDFVDDGKKRKKCGSPAAGGDDFEFDEGDARFSRIFSSAEYNIDPSNPHFRKTPAMTSLMQRKAELVTRVRDTERGKDCAVAGLVAAVKANTKKLAQRRRHH